MIKLLIGGSPCTFWSVAQKKDREVEAEGLGWELFKNFLIARDKFKPDFFLYENNKSAAQAIKDQISRELGVDLMYINSSLVSAQHRQRFYAFNWTVEQPKNRGIHLDEILTDDDLRPYTGGQFIKERDPLDHHIDTMYRIGATGKSGGQAVHVYDLKGKSPCLQSQCGGGGARTGLYLWPDGKVYALNARGAEKLQTLPAGYLRAVDDNAGTSAAGNGWTAEVIIHILSGALKDVPKDEEIVVLSMYDGIATGRYCLDKMGFTNVTYYAYEIDEPAMTVALSNYPDIIQCGDAFDLRRDDWQLGKRFAKEQEDLVAPDTSAHTSEDSQITESDEPQEDQGPDEMEDKPTTAYSEAEPEITEASPLSDDFDAIDRLQQLLSERRRLQEIAASTRYALDIRALEYAINVLEVVT